MPARDRATFRDTLEAAQIDLGTFELRSDGTVGPVDTDGETADPSAMLPKIGMSSADLTLGEVIGVGGMGRVHAAKQTSLGRTVAVKVMQEEARSPRRVRDFILEARVTGLLEHPNIVPIHGLTLSDDQTPWMIMKRVVGESWHDLIERTHGEPDHLERHLPVLRAVCNAVEAAHAQGILHRDLKPENVLVGDFGEVLLVDWGLAIAFGDPPVEDLPRTKDARLVVGTPRYMAPEMAIADGKRLTPETDVYLLGATLHHVLTNDTRHEGDTLMELLYQAYASEPFDYGPAVPEELARIANRACEAEPEDRFPDVASFRRALAEYESHAGSIRLAEEAAEELEGAEDEALTECRVAFEQALTLWPDNPAAKRGLHTALEREVTRALDDDRLDTASTLLTQLERLEHGGESAEDSELRARLDALRERVAQRKARVEALERTAHESNLGIGVEGRRGYGVAFGALFGLYNVAVGLAVQLGGAEVSHFTYTAGAFCVAAVVGTLGFLRLPRLAPNRAARDLLIGLAVILAAQVPVFLSIGALGVGVEEALAVSLLQLGGSFALKALTLDARMASVGLTTVVFGLVSLQWPALSWYAVGLCYAAFFIAGSLLPYERIN